MYRQFSFYCREEKPVDSLLYLYFECLTYLRQMRGRHVIDRGIQLDDLNVYLHIPKVVRIFCFRDWFNTRMDIETTVFGANLDWILETVDDIKKYYLTRLQELNVDYNVLFFDITNKKMISRIDLEAKDRWRF